MEQTAQIKECAHTVAGIVAHVDAGKTTLAESKAYAFRYARPCGFFGRDGTNTSGA